jgi:DNA-binding NtrC family response regulator
MLTRVGASAERRVDVRVVAATHRDLEARVAEGAFREDLFFRLNALSLKVPPLRERREDILPLAEHFLAQARSAHGGVAEVLAPEARAALLEYRWPGNARELRNVMHRAAVICSSATVRREDLDERVLRSAGTPSEPVKPSSAAAQEDDAELKGQLQRYERELLLGALRAENWNQTAAAKRLGMPRRTLVYKLTALGIREELDAEKKK